MLARWSKSHYKKNVLRNVRRINWIAQHCADNVRKVVYLFCRCKKKPIDACTSTNRSLSVPYNRRDTFLCQIN